MKLSRRIQSLSSSPIRKLTPYAEAAKAKGRKVYHLNIGQPDVATPPAFMDSIRATSISTIAYTNSKGEKPLLEAISKYYKGWNLPYEPEEITVTNGGSEALLIAVMALCDPGDEILVFEPYYANYSSFAKACNVEVKAVRTSVEQGYHLPSEQEIVAKISDKTKAVLLTNPGNPTGVVYSASEMELIAKIIKEHDLVLVADEVYREFVYDGSYRSFAAMPDIDDRVVIADSISKRYSACGARIGALLSHDKEFTAQVLKFCQVRLCVPTLEQIGATALYNVDSSYFKEVNDEYLSRRNTLHAALSKIPGVKCPLPGGAFYMMVQLPVDDAEKFAIWLLEEFEVNGETVMFAPGAGFYTSEGCGVNEARLAYVLNCKDLEKAAFILGEALKVYPGRC